jgi:hypothetical protein
MAIARQDNEAFSVRTGVCARAVVVLLVALELCSCGSSGPDLKSEIWTRRSFTCVNSPDFGGVPFPRECDRPWTVFLILRNAGSGPGEIYVEGVEHGFFVLEDSSGNPVPQLQVSSPLCTASVGKSEIEPGEFVFLLEPFSRP